MTPTPESDLEHDPPSPDDLRWQAQALRDALSATTARSSEDLLAALLDAIPDFVYFKDRQRRFVRASRPFAAMFQRPLSEILGRRDEDLFPPEVAATTVPDDEAVLRGQAIVDRIEGGELPTGERWVSTTKVPWRDAQGHIIGLLGISRDITASKQRVDALHRHCQRALRLETLGRLAGGVAHDFNNQLMVILGSAEELSTVLPSDDPAHELAELIVEAAQQARGLTHQLQQFGRREPGAPQTVRLDRTLHDLIDMLRRLMPDDIEVRLTCVAVRPVLIDPVRLQQAIFELALLGRDAMRAGGRLSLSLEPAAREQQPGVLLGVAYTGEGLDPAVQGSLIAGPVSPTSARGSLEGIARLVDEAGGTLEVLPEPARGTAIRLWLPCVEADARPTAPPPARVEYSGTALLVDDDAAVRGSVARMLERLGYVVVEAEDRAESIAATVAHRFDLVVTDVILRAGTGLEVAEAVRARQADVPVLYISGFTNDAFERRGITPDALDLLLKPFTHVELQDRIARLLAR